MTETPTQSSTPGAPQHPYYAQQQGLPLLTHGPHPGQSGPPLGPTLPPVYGPAGNIPPRPGKARRGAVALIAASVLGAGLLGGVGGALVAGGSTAAPAAATSTASAAPVSSTEGVDVSAIAAKVLPSVVQINVRTGTAEGIGSGVILSSDGKILTNNHVVSGAREVTVTLSTGETVPATVLGTDPSSDLAVVQAQGVSGLTAATLGDSGSVRVGDEVVAVGSPGGLQGTVTSGIVSALDRDVTIAADEGGQSPYSRTASSSSVTYKAIQTDASINQGNSGGPLFDTAGEVVGINSAIYSPVSTADGAAGSVGIGFSIPVDTAKEVIARITG